MHTNERLQLLNNCLLSKSISVNYLQFSAYLSNYHDIDRYSERSFNRDIRELKDLLAERFPHLEQEHGSLIKYARSENRFYLVRDDISAFAGFSEKELSQLAHAIDQNKHLFTDGLGKGILQKLQAIGLENRLSRFHQDIRWPALQLIKDGERSGGQWLEILLEKIYKQEVVVLEHKGLKKTSGRKKIKALPLMIKEYNNGWYTGWYLLFYPIHESSTLLRPKLEELWCFALDRVVAVYEVKEHYQIRVSAEFNPADYFKTTLGVTRRDNKVGKIPAVILEISADSWLRLYLEKYPIHFSQKIALKDDRLRIYLNLEVNTELENFVLQYLDEFKIVEPIELKTAISKRLEQIFLYPH